MLLSPMLPQLSAALFSNSGSSAATDQPPSTSGSHCGETLVSRTNFNGQHAADGHFKRSAWPHRHVAWPRKRLALATIAETNEPDGVGTVTQCGIMSDLIGNSRMRKLAAVAAAAGITDAAADDGQTDLIEAVTFASLYGFQAIPIRIKILLHRALSTLSRKRAEAIIRRTGWKVDDFERGFIQEEYSIDIFMEFTSLAGDRTLFSVSKRKEIENKGHWSASETAITSQMCLLHFSAEKHAVLYRSFFSALQHAS
ncbi:unnamed protein product [Gongylonema pulchrum]|uniref:SEC63 domain-containing protein n=1 Tax=Gongylonema pulchrum TaxID=637853 RepID=A0A183DNM0_9BILA|nr:unnamed protein product [Gongylonema pulchrum]